MQDQKLRFQDLQQQLSALPAITVGAGGACVVEGGVGRAVSHGEAARMLADRPHVLCNGPLVARRLGLPEVRSFDVLELFAFLRPAVFVVPTIPGLATHLGLPRPMPGLADEAQLLGDIVDHLITEAHGSEYAWPRRAGAIADFMRDAGWPWGPYVSALFAEAPGAAGSDLAVWRGLPDWEDAAPRPQPDDRPVAEDAAMERLHRLLGEGAEQREGQDAYTKAACFAFSPRQAQEAPNVAVLEAGTGIGKTLGYIAPASAWSELNAGAVWISTYTKNLQRQIDQELDRLYPDPKLKSRKAVVRKGRENYLCLLNLEEAVFQGRAPKGQAGKRALLGLILRWALYTRDGDLVGGDMPGWLSMHLGAGRLSALSDRRGECVYSACAHYRRCFIERVKRRAREADLVIANHALVMHEAAARGEESDLPGRLIFDEGHHVFDAADSAFSLHLSGLEARELRRWLRGRDGKSGGRARGLKARVGDLVAGDDKALGYLDAVLEAARMLPDDGWLKRIHAAMHSGPVELFLSHARAHVLARAADKSGPHSLEAGVHDPAGELVEAATDLAESLMNLGRPMALLARSLRRLLEDEAETLSSSDRGRIDSAARSLSLRAEMVLQGWVSMLQKIGSAPEEDFVDWLSLERGEAREFDIGLHRHWVDPTRPFAEVVLNPAKGVIITSATMRDRNAAEAEENWRGADIRSGSVHMVLPPRHHSFPSPFDFATHTRVFVVNDVDRNDGAAVAGAYRALFDASGGGALGLFTAISRLRAVYHRIAPPLEDNGLPLLAQHVDPVDAGTLVDMFRDDPTACLLGTDAMRDGVDVPGASLRLVVFDRVPWPRPDILHRARKEAFGGAAYDDMVTRLRLKQAFGRLVRRASDRGVFVMLDARTPSRLLDAFPEGTSVTRQGLADTVAAVRAFLNSE